MSGGHWDYKQENIDYFTEDLINDKRFLESLPNSSGLIIDLMKILHLVLHEVDWDFSGDTEIEDYGALDEYLSKALKLRVSPEVFKKKLLKLTRG